MSTPNIQIYCFEDALESAVNAWLITNGLNDPKKQRGNDVLKTPRIETRFLFSGFSTEHYWINQTTTERWLDLGDGSLYLKIVTRRDDSDQNHPLLRGMCRWLMQNRTEISNRMPLHRLDKIREVGSTIAFSEDNQHDISAMQYAVNISILPGAFPQT